MVQLLYPELRGKNIVECAAGILWIDPIELRLSAHADAAPAMPFHLVSHEQSKSPSSFRLHNRVGTEKLMRLCDTTIPARYIKRGSLIFGLIVRSVIERIETMLSNIMSSVHRSVEDRSTTFCLTRDTRPVAVQRARVNNPP